MRYILCLLFVFGMFGCSNSQQQETEVPVKQVQDSPNKGTLQTVAVRTPPARKDTIKPTPSRSNYVVDTARPKNKIKAEYPYDIDLKLVDGSTIKSDQLLKSGKPTVLLFWLTTCYPCRLELKAIKDKYAQWQQEADFNLYAISTDFAKNYHNFVKRIETEQWPWQAYNDVNREFRRVMPGGLNGLPQTFILDKNGEIVYHKRKYRPGDEDALFEKVKAIASK